MLTASQRFILMILLAACSGPGSSSANGPASSIVPDHISILPRSIALEPGGAVNFRARNSQGEEPPVRWTVLEKEGGNIDDSGAYTAPPEEGAYTVSATSVEDSEVAAVASVVVFSHTPIDMEILPPDRRTVWNPGLPGGIPLERVVHTTLDGLPSDGTGDVSSAIQEAIEKAGEEYRKSGTVQEVLLREGTYRFTESIALNRSGVVLRGQGTATRLRFDGNQNDPAIRMGRSRWTNYGAERGPWRLVEDGIRGDRTIALDASDAKAFEKGDILGIDEEDDTTFVRRGDGWYGKRQPSPDTHGPALRGPDLHRSVGTMIEVVGKNIVGKQVILTLRDPLHMSFRVSKYAEVFHLSSPRKGFDEIQWSGLEDFYLTGGTIDSNNISYCWIDGLEVDGNPGTKNIGTYTHPGGISGHSVEFFHAYRCELRNSYIHHSRNITQGGGSYLVTLSGYTSETLIEDNIIVFGNKLVVGNMMGGGNVIAYNYVDNARTNSATWQEGAIDLNHLSFSHNALVEGNWTSNMGADTTHGNSGWHVFHRNFATGQNSEPIYGEYPYISGNPDTSFRRAAGIDGYQRESTFIGNVLMAGTGEGVYQVDHTAGPRLSVPAVFRIGGGVDGRGEVLDDGTALGLLYRHGNWDSVNKSVVWDEENKIKEIPDSLYLQGKPAFFGAAPWPWVDPLAETEEGRVRTLPAKERYDALVKK